MDDFTSAEKSFDESISECEATIKTLRMWKRKCETHKNDTKMSTLKAAEKTPTPIAPKKEPEVALSADQEEAKEAVAAEASKPAAPPAPAPNVRTDWYQTANVVTVCFFIKMGQQIKGSKDHGKVNITQSSLDVDIVMKDGTTYTWKASPLCSEVDVEKSTYKILPMKVEVSLIKKAAGESWERLEGENTAADYPEKPSSYPSSNKKSKDWNKIEKEVEDDQGSSALDKLLKDIYGEGNPEVMRAMNKSYVESNGTVLSTNWGEVGAKTVVGAPPKGMEERKWGE